MTNLWYVGMLVGCMVGMVLGMVLCMWAGVAARLANWGSGGLLDVEARVTKADQNAELWRKKYTDAFEAPVVNCADCCPTCHRRWTPTAGCDCQLCKGEK